MRTFFFVLSCTILGLTTAPACTTGSAGGGGGVPICTPVCVDKECGDDGCGGVCGVCAAGTPTCASGKCVASCVPKCDAVECGDDGCGGVCGTCPAAVPKCQAGKCISACSPACSGKECGNDGCGGLCGKCGDDSVCDNSGKCVATGPGPCSPSSPSGKCPTDQTCIAGSCCDDSQACGAACCAEGSICLNDGTGNKICAKECTTSSECPSVKACCALLKNGSGACVADDFADSMNCRCSSATECKSQTCGTMVSPEGLPIGPAVCKPNNGGPYNGCSDGSECVDGYCCLQWTWKADGSKNTICALGCNTDAQCAGATCSMLSSGKCGLSPGACQ